MTTPENKKYTLNLSSQMILGILLSVLVPISGAVYYGITLFNDLTSTIEEVNNPKLEEWIPAPPKPSPDAIWDNGHWVIPPPPSWTAEEWLNKEGYNSTALVTLLDLNGKLIAAGKSSVKLNAVKNWTDGMIASYAADPSNDSVPLEVG